VNKRDGETRRKVQFPAVPFQTFDFSRIASMDAAGDIRHDSSRSGALDMAPPFWRHGGDGPLSPLTLSRRRTIEPGGHFSTSAENWI
jgi:hypothetical protein